VHDAVGI